jgi:phosphoenolpyruvate carboxykinase (ATP)
MPEQVWKINRERAIDYLNTRSRIYVFDGYAGWDPRYRIKVRVVCARAYHCLFMRNMLIRPTDEQMKTYGSPDFTIYNAGAFPANRYTLGMTSSTSVAINFASHEMVILGTEYAGEMKKGIFTVMFYLMPVKHNVLTLHSSANEGKNGDVTFFFGLSGTGKTTLSTDPNRALIGDDEHCWSDHGVFNIEGGCYAKVSKSLSTVANFSALACRLRRNLKSLAPSVSVQSLKTSCSIPTRVSSITRTRP